MSDHALRFLERRWKATGDQHAAQAFLRERARVAGHHQLITARDTDAFRAFWALVLTQMIEETFRRVIEPRDHFQHKTRRMLETFFHGSHFAGGPVVTVVPEPGDIEQGIFRARVTFTPSLPPEMHLENMFIQIQEEL